MSATGLPHPPAPPAGDPGADACPRCGASLRPDQDWCLNCGAAVTTEMAGPPAWRAPIAIVAAVLAVAAVALVLAFLELSDDAERVAQAPAPTPATTPPPSASPAPAPTTVPPATPTTTPGLSPTPTTSPGPSPTASPDGTATPSPSPGATASPSPGGGGEFPGWPAGETAYTVILWSASTRAEAESKARDLKSRFGTLGILDSSDFSSLRPGYFVVFNGQYDSADEAAAAAESARPDAPGAYAKRVAP